MNSYMVMFGVGLVLSTCLCCYVFYSPPLGEPLHGLTVAFLWVIAPQYLLSRFVDFPTAIMIVFVLGSLALVFPFLSSLGTKLKSAVLS